MKKNKIKKRDNIFDFEKIEDNLIKESVESNNYIAIFDVSMFKYKTLYGVLNYIETEKSDDFKAAFANKFTNEVLTIFEKFDYNIKECVFAFDFGNWRKKIQSDYKSNRTVTRQESPIDFEYFNNFFEIFMNDLYGVLPFKFLKVSECEGDDVIGTITIYNKNQKTLILSNDKDFKQLNKHNKNIVQISPVTWQIIQEKSFDVNLHAVIGDKSDFVHQLKAGIGIKKAQKIIDEGNLKTWLMENKLEKQFQHNLLMVDLTKIPTYLQQNIINTYKTTDIYYNKLKVYGFNMKYGTMLNHKNIENLLKK